MKSINKISIVITVYNEVDSLPKLFTWLSEFLSKTPYKYEIIFIDDGSTDQSLILLEKFSSNKNGISILLMNRNSGKLGAQEKGINTSTGDIIVIMDSDLQHDPRDIPKLLTAIEKGADLVIGKRENKNFLAFRSISSSVLNLMRFSILGLDVKDFFSGFKVFRKEIITKNKITRGNLRYIPYIAYFSGYKIKEVAIKTLPRQFGKSKYGLRLYKIAILDIINMIKMKKFQQHQLLI